MPFFSKPAMLDEKQTAGVQASFVDILYDHEHYLSKHKGVIARPLPEQGKKVAIIGAGPAGLVAGFQLMQLGIAVQIFEADKDRYGGRIYSDRPIETETALFELGAMRVPPSEKLFGYYAKAFDMQGGDFPDPGKVDTNIIFDGTCYTWKAGGSPPAIFSTVHKSWLAFVATLEPIITGLKSGTSAGFAQALRDWQALINPEKPAESAAFSQISFYEGLVYLFVDNYKQFGLKEPWGQKEFALFGALGLGSGGFGPLYQVNFSEIVRLIVNGLETDQQFYPGGLKRLVDGFATTDTGYGYVRDNIVYDSRVTRVTPNTGSKGPQVTIEVNHSKKHTFDAVIVATTNRAMQVDMGLTLPLENGAGDQVNSLDEEADTGIRQLHLMNSSKLFVLTKSKFWKGSGKKHYPENIQTDGLVRGFYCLDYPHTDHGVVLISYTWGDDSTKYIAIKDANERLQCLLRSLQPFVPDFIDSLRSDIMPSHTRLIDWQDEQHYYGAFKLNYPGQDPYNQTLYYQFTRSDNGIYLAGDSISWSGGWIEGALQTGMNAAVAVVSQFKPENLYDDNPMVQKGQAHQYSYGF